MAHGLLEPSMDAPAPVLAVPDVALEGPAAPVAPDGPEAEASPPLGPVAALVRALRPKQWLKNLLVFSAAGAAGRLVVGPVLARTATAFVCFCLVASGGYLLNDVVDAAADRRHPLKRRRPIAAGSVKPEAALAAAAGLVAGGVALGMWLGTRFLLSLVVYVAASAAYSLWLKRIAVVDITVVAAGYVLRAVAGSAAAGVRISQWLLILVSFGSLFVVAGKRSAEFGVLGPDRAEARTPLLTYTVPFLRYVWMMASAVAVAAYCLWAFAQPHVHDGVPWSELSAIPFVMGVLRYALLLDAGRGGSPEDVILGDRTLQAIMAAWALVYGAGVYLGG